MESILSAVIAGFFSLVGIWYQNYLSRKANNISANVTSVFQTSLKPGEKELLPLQQNNRSQLRILFTILIALLPWLIWKIVLQSLVKTVYKHMDAYAKIMIAYFLTWIIITIIAIVSGWTLKTVFEKLILIISSICLLYWCIWMIIVHHVM